MRNMSFSYFLLNHGYYEQFIKTETVSFSWIKVKWPPKGASVIQSELIFRNLHFFDFALPPQSQNLGYASDVSNARRFVNIAFVMAAMAGIPAGVGKSFWVAESWALGWTCSNRIAFKFLNFVSTFNSLIFLKVKKIRSISSWQWPTHDSEIHKLSYKILLLIASLW